MQREEWLSPGFHFPVYPSLHCTGIARKPVLLLRFAVAHVRMHNSCSPAEQARKDVFLQATDAQDPRFFASATFYKFVYSILRI